MRPVRWTHAALGNLDSLAEWIARDDPAAAASQVMQVFAAVDHLARHPALGRAGRVPGTRELVVSGTPYIVPYRVCDGAVEILRVFHAARRWPESI